MLQDVVRQDQSDPDFILFDWTVRLLSNKGAVNPEGLWCFSGHGQGHQGIKPWSVVLKILKDPGNVVEPGYLWYWKREYLAHESGLLSRLPRHIAQARSYGTSEDETSAWLWMELVADTTDGPWGLDEYEFAACQLGRFNAGYVTGTPLPNYAWLATNHIETLTSLFGQDNVWPNPHVQQAFSPQIRARVMALWADKVRFLATLQRLPQAFSHFDYKRSNLFIRRINDSHKEVAAVDWGDCGVGVLGGDLTRLVGGSTFFRDWDAALLAELDTIAFAAYLDGLQAMGWSGDPALVRLAYSTWFALDWASTAPGAVVFTTADENRAKVKRLFGCEPEAMIPVLVTLCEFALERAEEARQLMARLNLA